MVSLENALENATGQLEAKLKTVQERNLEVESLLLESSNGLELAHKGRDTAEVIMSAVSTVAV